MCKQLMHLALFVSRDGVMDYIPQESLSLRWRVLVVSFPPWSSTSYVTYADSHKKVGGGNTLQQLSCGNFYGSFSGVDDGR